MTNFLTTYADDGSPQIVDNAVICRPSKVGAASYGWSYATIGGDLYGASGLIFSKAGITTNCGLGYCISRPLLNTTDIYPPQDFPDTFIYYVVVDSAGYSAATSGHGLVVRDAYGYPLFSSLDHSFVLLADITATVYSSEIDVSKPISISLYPYSGSGAPYIYAPDTDTVFMQNGGTVIQCRPVYYFSGDYQTLYYGLKSVATSGGSGFPTSRTFRMIVGMYR